MDLSLLGKAYTCIKIGGEATDLGIHNFSIGFTKKIR
jgi:hypothetical protein